MVNSAECQCYQEMALTVSPNEFNRVWMELPMPGQLWSRENSSITSKGGQGLSIGA